MCWLGFEHVLVKLMLVGIIFLCKDFLFQAIWNSKLQEMLLRLLHCYQNFFSFYFNDNAIFM